jgi:hypothetical protein
MKKALLFPTIAMALALADTVGLAAQDFSGSLEARLGWSWKAAELLPLSQVFTGGIEGAVGEQDLPAARYSGRLEVSYDPASAATSVELGETWAKLFAGPFDISLGNQVVAWSNSDAFWPSDVVNPMDLSLPVDPVKLPVPMGRILYNGKGLTIDLVAQPFWRPSLLPGSAWQPAPSLPAGMTVTGQTLVDNRPASVWDNAAYGGHIKASLGLLQGFDIGATFYRGRLPTPRATVDLLPTATPGSYTVATTLDYDRFNLIGADMLLAAGGGLLLKTEWGYKTLRDTSILEPEAGAASIQGVSGFEYRLGGVQLIGEYVLDWKKESAAEGDSLAHSAVGIASMDIGSRLNLKAAAIHEFKGTSGMVSPQLSYTLADGLKLSCAAFFFYGAADTTYGAWEGNSLGRVSLKQSF